MRFFRSATVARGAACTAGAASLLQDFTAASQPHMSRLRPRACTARRRRCARTEYLNHAVYSTGWAAWRVGYNSPSRYLSIVSLPANQGVAGAGVMLRVAVCVHCSSKTKPPRHSGLGAAWLWCTTRQRAEGRAARRGHLLRAAPQQALLRSGTAEPS